MRLIQFFEAQKRMSYWDLVDYYDVEEEARAISDLSLPWINDNKPGKISSMARNPKFRLVSQLQLFLRYFKNTTNYGHKVATPEQFEAALNKPIQLWRGGGGDYDAEFKHPRPWVSFTADERRLKTFSQYDGTYAQKGLPGTRLDTRNDYWEVSLSLPLKDVLLYLSSGYDEEVIVSKKDAARAEVISEGLIEAANPNVKVKKVKGGIYNAYLKGRKVGQAQVYDYEDERVGENERYIWKSATHPDYLRQGVATELYNVIANDLASQGLKLVPSPDSQLSGDAYQFWKARDPESIKGHGTYKAEKLQHYVGRELEVRGRPAVVTRVGWSIPNDAPTVSVRFTDVPEGSANSTSYLRFSDVADQLTEDEKISLPDLETGDEMMVGKFKNRKATIKGFKKDKHNQPVAKTNKGDQQIFKGRIKKLMDEARLDELQEIGDPREMTREKLAHELEKNGWYNVDDGTAYSDVYVKEGGPWAIKILRQSQRGASDKDFQCAMKWYRYCLNNWQNNPHLPQIRYVKTLKSSEETVGFGGGTKDWRTYVVMMERLEELNIRTYEWKSDNPVDDIIHWAMMLTVALDSTWLGAKGAKAINAILRMTSKENLEGYDAAVGNKMVDQHERGSDAWFEALGYFVRRSGSPIILNRLMKDAFDIAKQHRHPLMMALDVIRKLQEEGGCRVDLHDENVMIRPSTGELVITDPVRG